MENDYYSIIRELAVTLEQDFEFYKQFDELECDKEKGILPRALFLEKTKAGGKGCILVGLNPGKAKKKEMQFAINSNAPPAMFNQQWFNYKYHKNLKNVMEQLGYRGDILWTELVKCQSKDKRPISLQTIRKEFKQHLQKEIKAVPESWLLVGIGNEAYQLLARLYPDRTVLGVHHSTGSRLFHKLFNGNKDLKEDVK